MSDVWTCCQCGNPNLIATAPERCPVCGHIRRSCCRAGRPTFSKTHSLPHHPNAYPAAPSSSGGQSYHCSPTQYISPSMASSARTTPRYYNTNYTSSSYPSAPFSSSAGYPSASGNYASNHPSVRGWWVCCCCQQSYNPALVPERCPLSGHQKCSECRVLR